MLPASTNRCQIPWPWRNLWSVAQRPRATVDPIARARVDAVRTVVDGGLEGGQTAGGADQVEKRPIGRQGLQ